jgi:hypothetical protein
MKSPAPAGSRNAGLGGVRYLMSGTGKMTPPKSR